MPIINIQRVKDEVNVSVDTVYYGNIYILTPNCIHQSFASHIYYDLYYF